MRKGTFLVVYLLAAVIYPVQIYVIPTDGRINSGGLHMCSGLNPWVHRAAYKRPSLWIQHWGASLCSNFRRVWNKFLTQIRAALISKLRSVTSAAELFFFFFVHCCSREALSPNFHFASNNVAFFQPVTHTEFDEKRESYRAVAHFFLPRICFFFLLLLAPVHFLFFFLSDLRTFLDYYISPPALIGSFGCTPFYRCFSFVWYLHAITCNNFLYCVSALQAHMWSLNWFCVGNDETARGFWVLGGGGRFERSGKCCSPSL